MFEKEIEEQKEVIVLGKTFASEEERRKYFRAELRKKLPELKKMEGFPIGEDEDIINLSDPPYYTACPNPWLNDFIEEWEEEKKEMEKQGVRTFDFQVNVPYASDVSEGKNNPIYSAHSYHTKVPHPAIMRYILHFTQPGDTVFDGFSGTGMLGVACNACEKPNDQIRLKIEEEFSKIDTTPVWGLRNSIMNDLSPISTFIGSNYNLCLDINSFNKSAIDLLEEMHLEYDWMYKTLHQNNKGIGFINYVVWSEIHLCEACGSEFEFSSTFMNSETKKLKKKPKCPTCSVTLSKGSSQVVYESFFDEKLQKVIQRPKRVPYLINYTFNGKKYEKKPGSYDLEILNRVDQEKVKGDFPSDLIPIMQMIKVGRMQTVKVSHIHHFFLKRQLIVLSALWQKALKSEDTRIRNSLLFFVEQTIWGMSILNRYSPTHFSQVNRALSGVFYAAAHISEVIERDNKIIIEVDEQLYLIFTKPVTVNINESTLLLSEWQQFTFDRQGYGDMTANCNVYKSGKVKLIGYPTN